MFPLVSGGMVIQGLRPRRIEEAMNFEALRRVDPVVAELLAAEQERQCQTIDLIASENLCPRAVREAVGSILTDKYAEGYPAHRWYGGCSVIDAVEQLAIDRGKRLFGGGHINVQPHSGSQANMAVYFSILEPGATILSMDLAHGGHLTHGKKANFSGRLFRIAHYGVSPETEQIDYDEVARLAREARPDLIVAGASAYPRAINVARMAEIARDVRAKLMVDMAHFAGLVVAGQHPDPVPVSDFVTATTHKTLRGPRGGLIICKDEYAKAIDHTIFPGIQGGPLMHVIAGKAVAFALAMTESFKAYQVCVVANARAMADEMAALGYRIVSGGTDTHLFLADLSPRGLSGAHAQAWLGEAGIVVNKNAIPFDQRGPADPSGIRIGTPSATTRGADEAEVRRIARWIDRILSADDPEKAAAAVRPEVREFCRSHPIPD
jgi:glycine hydroxymethyltransferase